jgi:membrane fusion protein (multidrug efflux system)
MILRRAIGPLAAAAQTTAAEQVAVGVVTAKIEPVYETSQCIGRILAEKTVDLVARVTGFLERRLFRQSSHVAEGELLYVIEQPPYQTAVAQSQVAVAQAEAQLSNAVTTLNRQLQLLHIPAGQQSTVHNDRTTQFSDAAPLASARA